VRRGRYLGLPSRVSLPDRALVVARGPSAGSPDPDSLRARVARPSGLLVLRRVAARGAAPDVLEVLTTETRVDPAPAARERGICPDTAR
jgi:hypothetical protein